MSSPEKISLYCTTGGASKEYHLELFARDGGWVVDFRYGAIGSALRPGTKTAAPVAYDKAKKIYDKIVREKTTASPPYTTGEHGNAYQEPVADVKHSGMLPQLLNDIEETDVEKYLRDPDYFAQEKHDGERRMSRNDNGVIGTNKKGAVVPLSLDHAEAIAQGVRGISELDGEDLGSHYAVFDMLKFDGKDLRALPYSTRLESLEKNFTPSGGVVVVETARTESEKRALLKALIARGAEGIVFKRASAPFSEGRPNSFGDQLKFKFYAEATVEVTGPHPTRRSVAIRVHDYDGGNETRDLGNVTIPPDKAIPRTRDIIDVRYLHCHVGGDLAQAVYKGPRPDADVSDCKLSQLKYKVPSIYKLLDATQAEAKPSKARKVLA